LECIHLVLKIYFRPCPPCYYPFYRLVWLSLLIQDRTMLGSRFNYRFSSRLMFRPR
jgi:hypothetical protein